MISSVVENLIIQYYLQGLSRDEIAEHIGVSKGTVSNKINEWKKRISAPDIEDLRQFAVITRKCGMTIKQLAKGFRTLQILKSLGITDESQDIDSDLDGLTFFVNEIYKKCNEHGITPNILTVWVTDLIYFASKNYGYLNDISKNLTPTPSNENQNNVKKIIPFISMISGYIETIKKELEEQEERKKVLLAEINQCNLQKKELVQNIQNLILKNDSIVEFLDTFSKLNDNLVEQCGIDLKKNPRPFTKLLYDYKENGYDMIGIVEEYNKGTNLKLDIIQKKSLVQSCENQLIKLQENIKAYESRLDMHRKNWDIYEQLKTMKFGIEELQQLWLTISEIVRSIGDPLKDFDMIENPVAYFIKDVEDNYYNKVKFEDKVNAKRNELSMINVQLNNSRQNLSFQPFIGSTLFSLFQKGINEQDIIEINQVFKDSLLLQNFSIDKSNNDNKYIEKEKGWRILIEELKKYGGIKAAIKEQSNLLDKIKKENVDLSEKCQNLSVLCQNVITLINMINSFYHYHKGFFDCCYSKIDRNGMITNRMSLPLIVILFYYDINDKQDTKEKRDDNDTDLMP